MVTTIADMLIDVFLLVDRTVDETFGSSAIEGAAVSEGEFGGRTNGADGMTVGAGTGAGGIIGGRGEIVGSVVGPNVAILLNARNEFLTAKPAFFKSVVSRSRSSLT
jgi:hypothetical protein